MASELTVHPKPADSYLLSDFKPELPDDPSLADVEALARRTRWSTDPADVPKGGMPARLVRAINVGELLDLATAEAKRRGTDGAGQSAIFRTSDPSFAAYLAEAAKADLKAAKKLAGRKTGRRGLGIDHYLLWAVRYAERVAEPGGKRRPYHDLSEQHRVTVRYVRDTVQDAKIRYGLLTKPGQGKAGGQLTEKALQLLAERVTPNEEEP